MAVQALGDRAVVAVEGADAAPFLHGLVTTGIVDLLEGAAVPAVLLTPQGKILFEMLVARETSDRFLIDCHAAAADALARRLGFYRLRAQVEVATRPDLGVAWAPAAGDLPSAALAFPDPRLAALGFRAIGAPTAEAGSTPYHAARIAAGVAEAGPDYDGETVPAGRYGQADR